MKELFLNIVGKSLRRQLLTGVVLTHTFLMSLFIFDSTQKESEFLYEQAFLNSSNLSQNLAISSTSWVLADDFIGLDENINSLKSYKELKYAMVFETDGKILAHTDQKKVGLYLADKESLDAIKNGSTSRVIIKNKNLIDVLYPIFNKDQHIAWARVAITLKKTNKKLIETIQNGFIYTFAAIMLGIIMAFFMAKSLTSSLYHLIEVITEASAGKWNLRVEGSNTLEINILAQKINLLFKAYSDKEQELFLIQKKLEDDIKERKKIEEQLVQFNTELEDKVLERTLALVTINENLKNEIKELKQNLKDQSS